MYQLKQTQLIKATPEACWAFFSDPRNLSRITPPGMGFKVRTTLPEKVYEGLMIAYTVSPVLGIPMGWVTEIKTVRENEFFVDEQRSGPYKIWHHEHRFEAVENGVLMTDIVSYQLPLGMLGRMAHALFVRRKLDQIFAYRRVKVSELFPD